MDLHKRNSALEEVNGHEPVERPSEEDVLNDLRGTLDQKWEDEYALEKINSKVQDVVKSHSRLRGLIATDRGTPMPLLPEIHIDQFIVSLTQEDIYKHLSELKEGLPKLDLPNDIHLSDHINNINLSDDINNTNRLGRIIFRSGSIDINHSKIYSSTNLSVEKQIRDEVLIYSIRKYADELRYEYELPIIDDESEGFNTMRFLKKLGERKDIIDIIYKKLIEWIENRKDLRIGSEKIDDDITRGLFITLFLSIFKNPGIYENIEGFIKQGKVFNKNEFSYLYSVNFNDITGPENSYNII